VSCEQIQERLTESFLARVAQAPEDAAHAAGCAACGAHARALHAVTAHLSALKVPDLRPAALRACEARALQVLRAQRAARAPEPLRGLGRDLLRAAALGLLALPVALGHAWFMAWAGQAFLGPWIPTPVLGWLGVFYFAPVALGLGVLYGAIPLAVVVGRRRAMEES
jgi:hypothetical protein